MRSLSRSNAQNLVWVYVSVGNEVGREKTYAYAYADIPTANPTATIRAPFTPALVLSPSEVKGSMEGLGVALPVLPAAPAALSAPVALGYNPLPPNAPEPGASGTAEVGARLVAESAALEDGSAGSVVAAGSVEVVGSAVPAEGSVEAAGSAGSVEAAGSASVGLRELTVE